jgi:tetraacyldisaccharide 4'-kinase
VGKTPLVEYVVRFLLDQGIRPAVLIRGYMDQPQRKAESDEARLLKESLPGVPIFIGRDRYENAKQAQRRNDIDVFIMDDGFQYWRLDRDLDIVVIDGFKPFGNRHFIPRGILREPLSSLRRADVVVLTKTDRAGVQLDTLKTELKGIHSSLSLAESTHEPVALENIRDGGFVDVSVLKNQRIVSVCSIGDPASFSSSLRSLDSEVVRAFEFIDHYQYHANDIEKINLFCQDNKIQMMVTTHKDSVKLKMFISQLDESLQICVLKIRLRVLSGQDVLNRKILDAIQTVK